ncbi:hypothetical protein BaRGS_00024197, partial [Batillaria attramentaria]
MTYGRLSYQRQSESSRCGEGTPPPHPHPPHHILKKEKKTTPKEVRFLKRKPLSVYGASCQANNGERTKVAINRPLPWRLQAEDGINNKEGGLGVMKPVPETLDVFAQHRRWRKALASFKPGAQGGRDGARCVLACDHQTSIMEGDGHVKNEQVAGEYHFAVKTERRWGGRGKKKKKKQSHGVLSGSRKFDERDHTVVRVATQALWADEPCLSPRHG